MPSHILIEACCASPEDVLCAALGGADRIELNCALALGGLTPSLGSLIDCCRSVSLPVFAMIRPREGGFCYSSVLFSAMQRDAQLLTGAGAAGIVFGFLTENGEIDRWRTKDMMEAVPGCPVVFHRAFDLVPDWRKGLETLIDLGVTRVLTSGQAPSAAHGIPVLREMIRFAQGAIEILPAAGIRPEYRALDCVEISDEAYKGIEISLYPAADSSEEAQNAYWTEVDTAIMTRLFNLYPVKEYPAALLEYVTGSLEESYRQYADMYGMDFAAFLQTYMKMDQSCEADAAPGDSSEGYRREGESDGFRSGI